MLTNNHINWVLFKPFEKDKKLENVFEEISNYIELSGPHRVQDSYLHSSISKVLSVLYFAN